MNWRAKKTKKLKYEVIYYVFGRRSNIKKQYFDI